MAENWADLNAMDGQDDTMEQIPPIEADADANNDDTARTRRSRGANPNDDTVDEGNPDEAPKPKRGRGRPKKDDDQQLLANNEIKNVNALRRELENLRSENSKLEDLLRIYTSRNEDIEKDLELTRASLLEKEQDYSDLLDQFSSHEETSAATLVKKPMGVVFFDDITEPLLGKLTSSIRWRNVKKCLSDIDETDEFKEADVVVLLTGACEISNGVSAFQLHQTLKEKMSMIAEHCIVYATSLPPNNKSRVQVDIYNHKFSNLTGDGHNINLVKVKFLGSKLDLVNFDGSTPSNKCVTLYENAFKVITPLSTVKETTLKIEGNVDFNVTAVIPIKSELVGRIIGKGGSMIRKITDGCGVKMSFGNWRERTSEAREEDPEVFTGVMIKGQTRNVKRAIDWVEEIVKSGRAK